MQSLSVHQSSGAGVRVAPAQAKGRRREIHAGDRFFAWALRVPAVGLAVLLLAIAFFLYRAAAPALHKLGWSFVYSSVWDPVQDIFGALPVVYGTVVSSFIAIIIATPLSIGVALFLTEIAPRRVGRVVGFLIEMLAAIPSVVYGLWGIFVLAPWLRTTVEPGLKTALGFLPFFQGPAYGVGMMAAGIILAIMITPTISSISREIFSAIPQPQREAALGLGATRWEMMRLAVLRSSKRGIAGAVILGLGRALGETMAVTMVIGNRHEISASFFAPSTTMASIIANEYSEATSDIHIAALVEVGLLLFAVTFIINSLARLFVSRSGNR
ncbi:MAG: phosphate ABC transporter permease subunit PstC [Deltaproteobacteria bacterium]|nr:phosphate ABC transporter permease subunit PstC [Deltaproteobacteria bacterium]